jgi:hypothetical protein
MELMPLQDFSNPLVRPHLHFYPERPDGPITEIWHTDKWRGDLDPTNFSPMYNDLQGRHYYINELAWMKNGGYIIPVRWVKWRGCLHADAYQVTFDEQVSEC